MSHDTELDSTGTVWNVGGGGAAGYKLTANPLAPKLLGTTGTAGRNPSPYNDFILHNSQRRGKTQQGSARQREEKARWIEADHGIRYAVCSPEPGSLTP